MRNCYCHSSCLDSLSFGSVFPVSLFLSSCHQMPLPFCPFTFLPAHHLLILLSFPASVAPSPCSLVFNSPITSPVFIQYLSVASGSLADHLACLRAVALKPFLVIFPVWITGLSELCLDSGFCLSPVSLDCFLGFVLPA